MDVYYGTAAAAHEAAQLWLSAEGSAKRPARVFDVTLGHYFRAKGKDGGLMRFFFSASGGGKRRARR